MQPRRKPVRLTPEQEAAAEAYVMRETSALPAPTNRKQRRAMQNTLTRNAIRAAKNAHIDPQAIETPVPHRLSWKHWIRALLNRLRFNLTARSRKIRAAVVSIKSNRKGNSNDN